MKQWNNETEGVKTMQMKVNARVKPLVKKKEVSTRVIIKL